MISGKFLSLGWLIKPHWCSQDRAVFLPIHPPTHPSICPSTLPRTFVEPQLVAEHWVVLWLGCTSLLLNWAQENPSESSSFSEVKHYSLFLHGHKCPSPNTFTPGRRPEGRLTGYVWPKLCSCTEVAKSQPRRQTERSTDACRLTSLVCGDVDGDVLWGEGTFAGDPIDGLDVKGVGGVGPQAADGDTALSQAQLPGHELYVVIAAGTAPAVCPALLTDDVVGDIIPPTRLPRRVPLQNDGCLIDDGYDIAGT